MVEKAKKETQMSGMLNCVKYPLISLTLTLQLRFLAMVYVFKFQMNKEGKFLEKLWCCVGGRALKGNLVL